MFLEHTSTEALLFFTLYGITGVVPLIAALYLLLCPGNAFAPDVTPPVRLRRWAASFFAVIALEHVWWMLLYIHSNSFHSVDETLHSVGYAAIVMLDSVAMLTTMVGTLLAMLQDRRRPIWPTFVAIVPFVALGGAFMVWHSEQIMLIAFVYALLLYVLFTAYMAFSVRQYRRWLRDNYADLERKEVWQTHMAVFCFMLIFFLYASIDVDSRALLYLLHIIQLVFFVFLLWRVETLPQLSTSTEKACNASAQETADTPAELETDPAIPVQKKPSSANPVNINLGEIERLLTERCVDTELYLQHDLSLAQLSQAIGTNRSYLSQYFSRQGITYNTYINNLRINHFISRYQEVTAAGQSIVALQLARESGYRSYSTFSLAFKQRTGLSVTAWMQGTGE